jgi:argininosuccinate synthase
MIAFCANIGQDDELKGLDKKARKTGASKIYIDDLQEEFATDFIFPMIRAGAIYEGQYFLGTSIARPLIAKRMVEIAKAEKADAIAHGATGKGNDQVRFELTAAALRPEFEIIAPWRDERFRTQFPGRAEMIAYCERKAFPCRPAPRSPSRWTAISCTSPTRPASSKTRGSTPATQEQGLLQHALRLPEDAPDKAEFVILDFEKGNCIAVNGKKLNPLGVMKLLNKLGGKHGVGRVDMVENRFVGMKSRGVYETPGGSILHFAHRQIESLTMDREVMHLRDSLIPNTPTLVYNGFWYAPERLALQALVDREPEERHRHRAREALQGQHHPRRPQVRLKPLQPLQSARSPPWRPIRRRPTTRTTPPASSASTACVLGYQIELHYLWLSSAAQAIARAQCPPGAPSAGPAPHRLAGRSCRAGSSRRLNSGNKNCNSRHDGSRSD